MSEINYIEIGHRLRALRKVYIPRPQIRVSAKIDQVFRLN